MARVPDYNNKPEKRIYNPVDRNKPITLDQRVYIITLCERHKIPLPANMRSMTKGEAMQYISNLTD